MSGNRGERSSGGSRPTERLAARREEEEFEAALTSTPKSEGKGTPMNIIRRPVQLPKMKPVKS
jgi:hypothetical protein